MSLKQAFASLEQFLYMLYLVSYDKVKCVLMLCMIGALTLV